MEETLFDLGGKSQTNKQKQAELSQHLQTEFAPRAGKAAVVRKTGVGYEGKVITHNALPSQSGRSLWSAMQGSYRNNSKELLSELIDKHVTGLMDISRVDWKALKEKGLVPPWLGIVCYCHPGEGYEKRKKAEEYWVLSSDNPIRLRWIYQVEEEGLRIFCTTFRSTEVEMDLPALRLKLAGRDFVLPFCQVERSEAGFWEWNGSEPPWEAIEAHGEKMNLWRLAKRLASKPIPSSDQLALWA